MPVPTAAAAAVRDKLQNLLDHLPWDCDLGHLEHDVAAVAHHLGAVVAPERPDTVTSFRELR